MKTASAIGIDFGTTNSALAWVDPTMPQAAPRVASFTLDGKPIDTFRSLLFFDAERDRVRGRPEAWVGPRAIESYLEADGEGRLMQSMKTFLASKHVKGTSVFGYDYSLELLVARVIEGLIQASAQAVSLKEFDHVVAGRPVHFAHAQTPADDAYAEERLRVAYRAAGVTSVEFVLEPVAAALHYEAGLTRDETVLVADFGGGTTDFCLLRVGPSYVGTSGAGAAHAERILAVSGLGVAGDALDARIVQHLVSPALGAGSFYRSEMAKTLEIPSGVFDKLKRWNELSFLKSPRNMEMLMGYARMALEPEKLRALIHLVDNNLGYRLYRSVEATKIALSSAKNADFCFADGALEIRASVARAEFETWIAPDLAEIGGAVDALLATTGLAASEVETVFLTGGTGLVPAVRGIFADRFGEHKMRTREFLTSIASGLALHAANSRLGA